MSNILRDNPMRVDLNRQIEEFFSKGGKVEHIPFGVGVGYKPNINKRSGGTYIEVRKK